MKHLLAFLLSAASVFTYAQNHDEVVVNINTIEEAKDYAAQHRDVIVNIVNFEKDKFLFDNVDTNHLEASVGTSHSAWGRTTKLLKDTSIEMIGLQVVTFDLSRTSQESAELLINQIKKRLKNGEGFWELKKKYSHTSAQFTTGPEAVSNLQRTYGLTYSDLDMGEDVDWAKNGKRKKIGILILEEDAHQVPAFYAISYNSEKDWNGEQ